MHRLVLISLMLTCCGQHETKIDAELRDYLRVYLSYAPNEGDLNQVDTIRIGDPGDENDGICTSHNRAVSPITDRAVRNIIIRREILGTASGAKTIFHELGHCLHEFEHSNNSDDIMANDGIEREDFWREHLYERLQAMFAPLQSESLDLTK